MSKLKELLIEEYEQAFPYEQEYNAWIAGVERDFQEEVEHRAKLVVTDRTNVLLRKNNSFDEYSPYITIDS
jgi:hypothetical protein